MNKIGLFLLGISITLIALEEKPIVVLTASYNNAQWYEKNIRSIAQQNYQNWRLIYIDDASTDGTANLVAELLDEFNITHKTNLIRNKERVGHLANQYHAIYSCKPHEIIIIVDGDDWLLHEQVFSYINTLYTSKDVWLTYGQFWYWKKNKIGFCKKLPEEVITSGTVRSYRPWTTSHLRTFYAGLFQRINYEDLLYQGNFFPMCADVATMMPMIEMAHNHIYFVSEILYLYNDDNPGNFFHNQREKQRQIEDEIRSRKPYDALLSLF